MSAHDGFKGRDRRRNRAAGSMDQEHFARNIGLRQRLAGHLPVARLHHGICRQDSAPSPASTRVMAVVTCITSYAGLNGICAISKPTSTSSRMPLLRVSAISGSPARSAHLTVVAPLNRLLRSQNSIRLSRTSGSRSMSSTSSEKGAEAAIGFATADAFHDLLSPDIGELHRHPRIAHLEFRDSVR